MGATTESWNGTSWTEVNDLNTARAEAAGCGTSTPAALCASGYNGTAVTAVVESFNGTSWTEIVDLNTARQMIRSGGSNTSAVVFGGAEPTNSSASEEFDIPAETSETITD